MRCYDRTSGGSACAEVTAELASKSAKVTTDGDKRRRDSAANPIPAYVAYWCESLDALQLLGSKPQWLTLRLESAQRMLELVVEFDVFSAQGNVPLRELLQPVLTSHLKDFLSSAELESADSTSAAGRCSQPSSGSADGTAAVYVAAVRGIEAILQLDHNVGEHEVGPLLLQEVGPQTASC